MTNKHYENFQREEEIRKTSPLNREDKSLQLVRKCEYVEDSVRKRRKEENLGEFEESVKYHRIYDIISIHNVNSR